MKRKLFKKFATVDFNEYHYAVINGEVYYAVGTLFHYVQELPFGMKRNRVEEVFFHSMKVPEIVMTLLNDFREDNEQLDLRKTVKAIKESMIGITMQAYTKMGEEDPGRMEYYANEGAKRLALIEAMFTKTWKNPLINHYIAKDFVFLFEEYNGRATRTVWLAQTHEDLINILAIKLAGNEKDNIVVDVNRLLLDKGLAHEFLSQIEKGEK